MRELNTHNGNNVNDQSLGQSDKRMFRVVSKSDWTSEANLPKRERLVMACSAQGHPTLLVKRLHEPKEGHSDAADDHDESGGREDTGGVETVRVAGDDHMVVEKTGLRLNKFVENLAIRVRRVHFLTFGVVREAINVRTGL